MKINGISAVTLFVSDMKKSCEFYSKIPSFTLSCGGPTNDFTTFEIGISKRTYLNLELKTDTKKRDFGRVIFYTKFFSTPTTPKLHYSYSSFSNTKVLILNLS